MKILALESSACAASVAIAEDGKLLGEAFLNTGLTHSQTLLPLVHGLLKNANLALDEIDAFAVTNGPGSFTGVRIGVAAIKGLAFPHDKPCIPLSTLEVIAFGQTGGDCTVCAAMDARCEQVYTALFSCRAGALSRLTEDAAMKITELPPVDRQKFAGCFCGRWREALHGCNWRANSWQPNCAGLSLLSTGGLRRAIGGGKASPRRGDSLGRARPFLLASTSGRA